MLTEAINHIQESAWGVGRPMVSRSSCWPCFQPAGACGRSGALSVRVGGSRPSSKWMRTSNDSRLGSGPTGCGKTHLAAAVANELLSRGHTVIFQSVPELLMRLRATYNRQADTTEEALVSQLVQCEARNPQIGLRRPQT